MKIPLIGRISNLWVPIAMVLCCIFSASLRAQVQNVYTLRNDSFIVTPFVKRQAQFWEKVFYIFPSTTSIIHDVDDPDIIIQIIDERYAANFASDEPSRKWTKEERSKSLLKELNETTKKIRQTYPNYVADNEVGQKLTSIYLRVPERRERLLENKLKFRVQTGLADRFAEASLSAQRYFPVMEQIFKQHDLPPTLTRMVFVESMFNLEAKSKVGASGIWQFMPETAKQFLFVSEYIDERNAPIKATKAAASLLLKNFLSLKSWPHAITAYNHGAMGMHQAMKSVGSRNFDDIILKYQSPSFGFASKNFYAEFIAARRIYHRYYSKVSTKSSDAIITTSLILPETLTLSQIEKVTQLPITEIVRMNPCILVKDTGASFSLPKYFELFAPEEHLRKLSQQMRNPYIRASTL